MGRTGREDERRARRRAGPSAPGRVPLLLLGSAVLAVAASVRTAAQFAEEWADDDPNGAPLRSIFARVGGMAITGAGGHINAAAIVDMVRASPRAPARRRRHRPTDRRLTRPVLPPARRRTATAARTS